MNIQYEFLVIGAGSGGLATANRVASYIGESFGKVAVVERGILGGTCVNVGCVPKKLMFNAACLAEALKLYPHYGFQTPFSRSEGSLKAKSSFEFSFNWSLSKKNRDVYVSRINSYYSTHLQDLKIDLIEGDAVGISRHVSGSFDVTITKNDNKNLTVRAKKVLIATGAHSIIDTSVTGYEHGIDSDGFFALESQPSRVGIVGSGYIATEIAGIFGALGSSVDMLIRGPRILKAFDHSVALELQEEMDKQGIRIHALSHIKRITRVAKPDGSFELKVEIITSVENMGEWETVDDIRGKKGRCEEETMYVDALIWAIGRRPCTMSIGLDKFEGALDEKTGLINVDENQQVVGVDGLYALGDIVKGYHLTPVAIATGRALADRLFGGPEKSTSRADLTYVPTIVFSHPPIAAVGLTEGEAIEKYGSESVCVYDSKFTPMLYGMAPQNSADRKSAYYKIVCRKADGKVLGIHIIGHSSDEIIQGFAVAMSTGVLTKDVLDRTIPLHPTAAEELVTMN